MKSLAVTSGKRNFALAFGKGASPKGRGGSRAPGQEGTAETKTAKNFAVTEIIRNFAKPFRRKKRGRSGGRPAGYRGH